MLGFLLLAGACVVVARFVAVAAQSSRQGSSDDDAWRQRLVCTYTSREGRESTTTRQCWGRTEQGKGTRRQMAAMAGDVDVVRN